MGNGSKGPRDVTVTVVVDDVPDNRYHFETCDLPLGPNNVLTFDNTDGYSGFHIHYALSGAEGFNFPTNLDEALYVKSGSKSDCPKSKSSWGQFQPVAREDNGRTLKVHNKNNTVQDFAYTLRATDGVNWLVLDPGGMNKNGGGDPPVAFSTQTYLAIGAVAVIAVVAFLVLR